MTKGTWETSGSRSGRRGRACAGAGRHLLSVVKEINSERGMSSPQTSRMGRPREITDEQIVAAARRCFLERGAGVSAGEIAQELGVSHTTLFNRFGSKEG